MIKEVKQCFVEEQNCENFYKSMNIDTDGFKMYRVYDGRNNQELGNFTDSELAYNAYIEYNKSKYDKYPNIEVYEIKGKLM